MSHVPQAPDSPLPGFSRNQLSPGAQDGKTAREIASERDIKQQPATHPAKSPPLQCPCPSSSLSPAASSTPGSRTNVDILIAETDKLIEDVLTHQQTDFAYVFHQPNSDASQVPAFTRSFPGSLRDFKSFSEYNYSHYKAFRLAISFDPAINQISISPRFTMGPGETALHGAGAEWATCLLNSMDQGQEPFLTSEQRRSILPTPHAVPLAKNTYAEEEEGENRGKKMALNGKTPDHAYRVRGTPYPCVVFETGWTESAHDLARDARQWLASTRPPFAMEEVPKGVTVVILTKIREVKGEELKEREKRRKEVLKSIGDGNAFEEEELLRPPTRANTNVDSWVGAIHCDVQVWRWNDQTNSPRCASQHVVLPEGLNENTRGFALWKRDMFPEASDGGKRFVPDMNELRNLLDEARHEYAFVRFSTWREMYLGQNQLYN